MLTVAQRGLFVATMRYVHVWLMETLAAWVPTTPEMEVKLLFGEHIWDAAQHADAFGKRTFELRMPLQHSLPPTADYVDFLAALGHAGTTQAKLAGIYMVLLPALNRRFQEYLGQTDSLSDAPTVRILQREMTDISRMCASYRLLLEQQSHLHFESTQWSIDLTMRERSLALVGTNEPTLPVVT